MYVVAHIDPLNEVSIFALRDTLGGPLALEVVLDVFSWSGLNSRAQKKWKINLVSGKKEDKCQKPFSTIYGKYLQL